MQITLNTINHERTRKEIYKLKIRMMKQFTMSVEAGNLLVENTMRTLLAENPTDAKKKYRRGFRVKLITKTMEKISEKIGKTVEIIAFCLIPILIIITIIRVIFF